MAASPRTLAELTQDGTALVEACANSDTNSRSSNLRALAGVLLDMRELCDDPDGRGQDYWGRSSEYREAAARVYRDADVEADERARIKSQVRYHTSYLLRDRLKDDPDTLERFGFEAQSVRDRNREKLRQRRALEDSFTPGEGDMVPVRMVHQARNLLDAVEVSDLSNLPGEAAEAVDDALTAISERSLNLRKETVNADAVEAEIDTLLAQFDNKSGRQRRAK